VKDSVIELPDLIQVDPDRNGGSYKNYPRIVVIHLVGPQGYTENNEQVKGSEHFTDEKHENVGSVDNHRSWTVTLPQISSFLVVQPVLRIFQHVYDSLSVLEVCCPDNSLDQEILHVPIGEANDLERLFFVRMVNFVSFFDNCNLAVII